ncbi:TatD family hydrolase [Botrytis cinerea]
MSTATNGVLEARQGDRPRYVDVHSPAQDFSTYSTADIIADHFFAPGYSSQPLASTPVPASNLPKPQILQINIFKNSSHWPFGEFGLDYDRLTLCPKDVQLEYFEKQLDIATRLHLPLFLHSRAAHEDFVRILKARLEELPKRGVVHSFTGTKEEMEELNLEVVKAIPIERLQIETDGPWCEIRPSHASSKWLKGFEEGKGAEGMTEGEKSLEGGKGWKSVKKEKWVDGAMIKGRNEPCMIGRVAWVVAGVKGVSVKELREAAWNNSCKMFDLRA